MPAVTVTALDAETRLVGAMIHMDHIGMEPRSEASRAGHYCFNIHNEKTDFFMAYPSHSRDAEAVVDAVYTFDDAQPEVRRWWADSAPECAAAAHRTGLQLTDVRSASTDWRSKEPAVY